MTNDFPQALTIAGTDSGGGAGISADFKTMQMRGAFATMVVVAVTAQNTLGVQDALAMPPKLIDEQFASLAADFKIRACKTGMLADPLRVKTVVNNLKRYNFGPLTVDPVMIAKGGAKLLSDDSISVVREQLLPLADLITPNLPEAEELAQMQITTEAEMEVAGHRLQSMGAKNVLVKGGHFSSNDEANDFVLLADGHSFWMTAKRKQTRNTHGTGDTISSCITAELAKGKLMKDALKIGKAYVEATIKQGINVGHGHGPLNHWAKIRSDNNEL